MAGLRTIIEINAAKHGAAELLASAAMRLQGAGADLDEINEALANVTSAKLALCGCVRALVKMSLDARYFDRAMAVANDRNFEPEERDIVKGRGAV